MKNMVSEIQMISLVELKPYERNPRLNDAAVDAVADSIRTFGFNNPILIRPDKTVIAGHTRLKAAYQIGLSKAPCIVLDHLTEAQAKAYNIADNRTAEIAEWDNISLGELLAELKDEDALDGLGWDNVDIDAIIAEAEAAGFEPQADDDDVPAVSEKAITRTGDIIKLGKHRVMCGDSTKAEDVAALMDGKKAILMVTDPPYGMDYTGMTTSVQKGMTNKQRRIVKPIIGDDKPFDPMPAVLLSGCTEVYLWGGDWFYDKLPSGGSWIVWDKRASGEADTIPGSPFEVCWSMGHHAREFIRVPWGGWNNTEDGDTRWHPTQKPVECMSFLICKHDTDLVYDPFLGSGSTLIACEKTGRTCFGMEISPAYCDVVVQRWENYTGKKAKRIKGAA